MQVRTVLGDIDASELGITYAHEHLVIAGGRPVEVYPDIRLDSVEKAVEELAPAQRLGLASVVDAMPADCGRDIEMLAEVSRRSGVHVIASTGLHTTRYYHDRHWSWRMSADEIAALFIDEIEQGIDTFDLAGPSIGRSEHRAGIIKVGGSAGFPDRRDRKVFEAAALAQAATGAPILTHCEDGLRGPEQVMFLVAHGADAGHIVLSHVDKVVDREYHHEIAAMGAFVEYDQAWRWRGATNGTLQLLEWMDEDGLIGHVVMGHDHARRGYWKAYGGMPGMSFLLAEFSQLIRERGLSDDVQGAVFATNPAAALSFIECVEVTRDTKTVAPSPGEERAE